MSYQWIRVSEINEYVYCRRSWWLKQAAGVTSDNVRQLESGTAFHQQHNQQVKEIVWTRRLAYALLFVVVAMATFQFLMGL